MKYFVLDSAKLDNFKETNFDEFLYFWENFGVKIINYNGKEIPKRDCDLDNTYAVYNPQGVLVAYKE